MWCEPTEIRVMNDSDRYAARRIERTRPSSPAACELASVDVLDNAFDEYTRIDAGTPTGSAPRDARAMSKTLIADIAAQLDILDRQRRQLEALLGDVK
jgi:hypothetical protein